MSKFTFAGAIVVFIGALVGVGRPPGSEPVNGYVPIIIGPNPTDYTYPGGTSAVVQFRGTFDLGLRVPDENKIFVRFRVYQMKRLTNGKTELVDVKIRDSAGLDKEFQDDVVDAGGEKAIPYGLSVHMAAPTEKVRYYLITAVDTAGGDELGFATVRVLP